MQVRQILLFATLVVPPSTAAGQGLPATHEVPRPLISGKQAAAAGLIVALTFMADQGLRGEVQEQRGGATNTISAIGNALGQPRYMFPVLGAGYAVGRLAGSPALSRAALRAGTAAIFASGISTALKYTTGRSRPNHGDDGDEFRPFSGSTSFPSGHTTFAFAVATAIADETPDRWSDLGLYGVATLTAFARVNDDRHWTSDVLVGALVGHLSARWLSRRQGWLSAGPRGVGISLEF
jgi:membrane-associated phospholipid phosphatase